MIVARAYLHISQSTLKRSMLAEEIAKRYGYVLRRPVSWRCRDCASLFESCVRDSYHLAQL